MSNTRPVSIGPQAASRRAFLQRASALSLAGVATPWALNLAALGEAAAATASDYKALVCVFLYGGNDQSNTLVPYDSDSHAAYLRLRAGLGHERSALTTTALNPGVALPGGRQYALAPGLAPLLPLFNAGRLAPLLNVGTLVQPTSKAQYNARNVPLPPKLFSHNDQQSVWQSSAPEGALSGWGGRLGDLFQAGNGNATFTCVNVSGNAVFLSGQQAVPYQVSTSGPVALRAQGSPLFGSAACSNALQALITQPSTQLLEAEHARIAQRALSAHSQLAAGLVPASAVATPFPSANPLADQLKMVARMLASAPALGAKRQVFFVSLGGFDNHDSLLTSHPTLLGQVAAALTAFHDATVALGVDRQVTTFTASDFGRTVTGNNGGSDHGWGAMQFVLGGAVQGGRFYGQAPVVADNGPDDVGQGRLLPSMAVDQVAATLGRWFGASDAELLDLLPNLRQHNASQRQLGFV